MPSTRSAALIYATAISAVALFQAALALGAPWGRFAMGGAFDGVLPPAMRLAALAQVLINLAMGAIVLSRAGVGFPRLASPSRILVWLVVLLAAIGTVLNLISPSLGERLLWTPVAAVLLLTSLRVALMNLVPAT